MNELKKRLDNLKIGKTVKHMRGRHDQRTHAWNTGMGRGTSGAALGQSENVLNPRRRAYLNAPESPVISSATDMDELASTISNMSPQEASSYKNELRKKMKLNINIGRKVTKKIRDLQAEYEKTPNDKLLADLNAAKAEYYRSVNGTAEAMEEFSLFHSIWANNLLNFQYSQILSNITAIAAQIDGLVKEISVEKVRITRNYYQGKEKEKVEREIEKKEKEIQKKKKESIELSRKLQENRNKTKDLLYDFNMEILQSLEHPNPIDVAILDDDTYTQRPMDQEFSRVPYTLSKEQRDELMRQTLKMFGQYGIKMAMLSHDYDTRASARTRADKAGGVVVGIIRSNAMTTASSYVHEALHVSQVSHPEQNMLCDLWAKKRIASDPNGLRSLNDILSVDDYEDDEFAYEDAVDNPYTLKLYAHNNSFMEVMTMAFTRMHELHLRGDRELLRIGLRALLYTEQ